MTLDFVIAYDSDLPAARKALLDAARAHPKVDGNGIEVASMRLTDNGVVMQLRAWCNTGDFGAAQSELIETGKQALDRAKVAFAFPQRVVRFADPDAPRPHPAIAGSAS